MILPIAVIGNPVLREKAAPIGKDYPGLDKLIADMFETMYNAEGVGLAAPQVGIPVRLFIIDGTPLADEEPGLKDFKKVFINAEISERSGDIELMSEGCLSIPNIREEVRREDEIEISWYDQHWNHHKERYTGFIARVIQHEYDHIDGILFTDRLGSLRKKLIKRRLNEIGKGRFDVGYKTALAGGR